MENSERKVLDMISFEVFEILQKNDEKFETKS